MIRIHKEGRKILILTSLIGLAIWAFTLYHPTWYTFLISILFAILYFFIVYFFRNPVRNINAVTDDDVWAPADGKVVVIEKVRENEYFKDERLLISIFMSPLNVHVNRNPISGTYMYTRYHPGKFLVAWHPKSSTENERTTTVIKGKKGEILMRQVAGALAKRIILYAQQGKEALQGQDMGFIRFGSRVDLYLPLNAQVMVSLDQKVRGNVDIIAHL